MLPDGHSKKSWGHPRTLVTWDYGSIPMLPVEEVQGHPRTLVIWDYKNVATLPEGDILGTFQDSREGTSQDMSEYLRNTLTSDGSPRCL